MRCVARAGKKVDNLVLVASPIAKDSGLAKAVRENDNIGRVIRIDIEGDRFSGGIDASSMSDREMEPHFYFIGNDQGQQEFLANVVKVASDKDFLPGQREIRVRIDTGGPQAEILGDDPVSSAIRAGLSEMAAPTSSRRLFRDGFR